MLSSEPEHRIAGRILGTLEKQGTQCRRGADSNLPAASLTVAEGRLESAPRWHVFIAVRGRQPIPTGRKPAPQGCRNTKPHALLILSYRRYHGRHILIVDQLIERR